MCLKCLRLFCDVACFKMAGQQKRGELGFTSCTSYPRRRLKLFPVPGSVPRAHGPEGGRAPAGTCPAGRAVPPLVVKALAGAGTLVPLPGRAPALPFAGVHLISHSALLLTPPPRLLPRAGIERASPARRKPRKGPREEPRSREGARD